MLISIGNCTICGISRSGLFSILELYVIYKEVVVKLSLLCFLLFCSSPISIAQFQTELWRDTVTSGSTYYKVDAAGNTVVHAFPGTQKIDGSGNVMWARPYPAVYVTRTGNVLTLDDNEIITFSPTGDSLSSADVSLYPPYAYDSSGNIYSVSIPQLTKISPTGTILWSVSLPLDDMLNGNLWFDNQNNCYIPFYAPGSSGILKLNANGSLAWRYTWPFYEETYKESATSYSYIFFEWYPEHFVVDGQGNSYLGGSQIFHKEVSKTRSYLGENSSIGRIEYVSSAGKKKTIPIKGKGKRKYVDRADHFTTTYIENENNLDQFVITATGRLVGQAIFDDRKIVRGEEQGDQYLAVFGLKRKLPKIQWKVIHSYSGYILDNWLTDLSGRLYIPLIVSSPDSDSVAYLRFDSSGTQLTTTNKMIVSDWNNCNRSYQFDAAGNAYAVCTQDLVSFLVKYAPGAPVALPGQSIVQSDREEIESFHLLQNYPNPFNPTTTIEFELANDALVTVKVYNTLGQEVAELIHSEFMDEGTQEVEFDATRMSSGIYYYRISAQDVEGDRTIFTSIKKMVLVK